MKATGVLLMLGSALLLASCNGTQAPSASNNVSGTVVEGEEQTKADGTITLVTKAWTGGAGTVVASTSGPKELTRATFAADGKFNLTLAAPSADRLAEVGSNTLPSGCTGTLTFSDPAVRVTELELTVNDKAIVPLTVGPLVEGGQTVGIQSTLGALTYVDRDVKIKGTQTCKFNTFTFITDTDVTFKKGWNTGVLTVKQNNSNATTTNTARNGNLPTNWVYINTSVPALSLQGLKSPGLPKFSLFR